MKTNYDQVRLNIVRAYNEVAKDWREGEGMTESLEELREAIGAELCCSNGDDVSDMTYALDMLESVE
jgi:hypothetical protein